MKGISKSLKFIISLVDVSTLFLVALHKTGLDKVINKKLDKVIVDLEAEQKHLAPSQTTRVSATTPSPISANNPVI